MLASLGVSRRINDSILIVLLLAVLLFAVVVATYDGPRLSSSVQLALRRGPLSEAMLRWIAISLRVPRRYPSLPETGSWHATAASLTFKQHDRVDGCWVLRIVLNTARHRSERKLLVRGPHCQPPPLSPPPLRVRL